jgi:penicillin amidase
MKYSPWWDISQTDKVETRKDIMRMAWNATIAHLKQSLGKSPNDWGWGRAHTLTHVHPLAGQKPLDWLFNVGPFQRSRRAGGPEQPRHPDRPRTVGREVWAFHPGSSTLPTPRKRAASTR